jgi:hypothetical protein
MIRVRESKVKLRKIRIDKKIKSYELMNYLQSLDSRHNNSYIYVSLLSIFIKYKHYESN